MSIWRMMVLLALAWLALVALGWLLVSEAWGPVAHESLKVDRVYAYRGWQSTGVQLAQGDWYDIRAEGTWLYSPYAGPNGPEGHHRYQSPSFYPLPNVPGGALIGRVGETGRPFYVGRGTGGRAEQQGLLYLRIDDDLLGDNQDYLTIKVKVTPPETPEK